MCAEAAKQGRKFEAKVQEVVDIIRPGAVSKGKPAKYWDTQSREAAARSIQEALDRAKARQTRGF